MLEGTIDGVGCVRGLSSSRVVPCGVCLQLFLAISVQT